MWGLECAPCFCSTTNAAPPQPRPQATLLPFGAGHSLAPSWGDTVGPLGSGHNTKSQDPYGGGSVALAPLDGSQFLFQRTRPLGTEPRGAEPASFHDQLPRGKGDS